MSEFSVGEFVGRYNNIHDVAIIDALSGVGMVVFEVESGVDFF